MVWKKCSTCKKDILLNAKYFACSVSTCKHPRTGFQFCSIECWDGHLGIANHREAWAVEVRAPKSLAEETSKVDPRTVGQSAIGQSMTGQITAGEQREPIKKVVEYKPQTQSSPPHITSSTSSSPQIAIANPLTTTKPGVAPIEKIKASQIDTLVVVSKVKQLIRERSEFNTSQCLIDVLTEKVAEYSLKAIQSARAAGRKTVMGRDVI